MNRACPDRRSESSDDTITPAGFLVAITMADSVALLPSRF
jgi:hypothetical protein